MLNGVVHEFDEEKGYGTIVGNDGRSWFFHCTQIADGSRTVAVGTAVRFGLVARLGRYEGANVTPG